MSQAYIGEIRMVGFNFPPRSWAFCNGQLLSIQQNAALFSILGTTYGGNGVQNFALPDLRGRTPLGFGNGAGLSPYVLGEVGGQENHTLIQSEMPLHNHLAAASTAAPDKPTATGNFWAGNAGTYASSQNANLMPQAIPLMGGSQPHPNLAPYMVVNFVICLSGIFPSRN